MNHYLITGANGFIGRYLINEILKNDVNSKIYAVSRKGIHVHERVEQIICDDICNIETIEIPWKKIDYVIHLAAKAHIQKKYSSTDFNKANVAMTEKICQLSAENQINKFIFLSTIGVYGNKSTPGSSINESTPQNPHSPYAQSKQQAEEAIKNIFKGSATSYAIIQPPLVTGCDAPGNFSALLRLLNLPIPLPFTLVKNKRSYIYCRNLANFIFHCLISEESKNETFVISDAPPLSTKELIEMLSTGNKRKPLFFPVPAAILKIASTLLGKQSMYTQLCGSLEVDSSKARTLLLWEPPYTQHDLMTDIKNSTSS